ncbi:peroxiredoxin family protein [Halovulum sp. GXIMD14793]
MSHLEEAVALLKPNKVIAGIINMILRQANDNTPAVLFDGIINYHKSKLALAHKSIMSYATDGMDNETVNYHTLTHYYIGMLSDDPQHRQQCFAQAFRDNQSRMERLNRLLLDQGVFQPDVADEDDALYISLDIELPRMERAGYVSLAQLIAAGAHELTPVCVMPSYRANGPYAEFMLNYARMSHHFLNHINPPIVVTDETLHGSTLHWKKVEDFVRGQGIPVRVLLDEDMMLATYLGQQYSPAIYVIDRQGKVQHDSGLDQPIDYWRLL